MVYLLCFVANSVWVVCPLTVLRVCMYLLHVLLVCDFNSVVIMILFCLCWIYCGLAAWCLLDWFAVFGCWFRYGFVGVCMRLYFWWCVCFCFGCYGVVAVVWLMVLGSLFLCADC